MNFTCWPYKKKIIYIYINILALHKENILRPLTVGALHMLIKKVIELTTPRLSPSTWSHSFKLPNSVMNRAESTRPRKAEFKTRSQLLSIEMMEAWQKSSQGHRLLLSPLNCHFENNLLFQTYMLSNLEHFWQSCIQLFRL